jgi:hypothetical protein
MEWACDPVARVKTLDQRVHPLRRLFWREAVGWLPGALALSRQDGSLTRPAAHVGMGVGKGAGGGSRSRGGIAVRKGWRENNI